MRRREPAGTGRRIGRAAGIAWGLLAFGTPVAASSGKAVQERITGLMAPEAYTLDAAVTTWVAGETGGQVREANARAYHTYQKCRLGAARRLFWSAPE